MTDRKPVLSTKTILSGCFSLVVVSIFGVYGCSYYFSDATRYCPLQHKFSDLASCEVLDERGGRILLQHADLDINVYYIEIIEPDGRHREFELPDSIGQLAPQGYSARLIAGEDHVILLNGRRTTLKALS